jgi:serine/threonine protein kinase
MWRSGDLIDGRYEVRQVFESGGMGVVYRVYHRLWNMDLALKQPRVEPSPDVNRLNAFRRECELWSNLNPHPHVVTCYYVRTINEVPSVLTEFVDGGSLFDWISSRRLYSGTEENALARILDFAIQAAWGLEHAHASGLVHQDVKPGNILAMADGTAKITDFGLADLAGGNISSGISDSPSAGFVSANGMTPAFCSPEQAKKERLSFKTDIYSWAVSVLEMFMGEVTWVNGMAARYALDEIRDRAPAPDIPDIPVAVFELLAECVTQEPERRPGGFREIADRLQNVYLDIFEEPHERMRPDTKLAALDACNNRALSLLDLGHPKEEIERMLQSVLEIDPQHPQAAANLALIEAGCDRENSVCLLLAKPRSGYEYYEEQRKFERLCAKTKRAVETGRNCDARRYLQQAEDLGSFKRHPRLMEFIRLIDG